MIDSTIFKTRFPEFDSVTDARIDLFIADAVVELEESSWGTRYDIALSYLTAHLLALANETASGNTGGIGPVASASADGLSVSYSRPTYSSTTSAYWESTSYGREFMRIKRTIFAPGFVTQYDG